MAFNWNRFAYTNFHELNLDWFNEHFKEIFEEWEELYNTLTQWKDDTDADLAQWKEDTLANMDTWERELLAALDEWKVDTGNDISDWESGVISDLNDWKETFLSAYESLEDRVEAIVSDTEDMVENLAEPFSTSENYFIGDYVVYNGILYTFTANHSAGAWTGTDVTQITAMNDITDLKNAIIDYNSYNILDLQNPSDYSWNGITYDWNNDGSCTIKGIATSTSFCNIYMNQNALPEGIKAGDILNIQYNSSNNIYFYIYDYTDGNTSVLFGATSGGQIKIPTTCTGLIIRLWIGANTGPGSDGETVKPYLFNYNRMLTRKPTNYGVIAASVFGASHLFSSANDINEDCRLFVSVNAGTTNITDVPSWAGELETIIATSNVATQLYYPYETEKHPVMIRGKIGGTWGTWISIGQRGYIEAVDTASEIETGKVNMTPAIKYALDTYGYCKLGPGVFYLESLVIMPDGSTVEGCGDATQVRLLHRTENNNGCFEMHKDCTVRGMSLFGQYSDLSSSDFTNISGTRYGILHTPRNGGTCGHCVVENVSISNFAGSGIYQYNTGQDVKQGLFVTDVDIKNCWAGIHNYGLAEFSRYENVRLSNCYIAAINNSGNCMWNNCVFNAYYIGMQIDGTRQNAGHGCCSNSSFCHSGNNTGSAITVNNLTVGYVFSANQFWYNSINLNGCDSIVFSACEMGRGTSGVGMNINISGGNTIMFDGCVFWNDTTYPPAISIASNTKTKFINCYGGSSGNAITA